MVASIHEEDAMSAGFGQACTWLREDSAASVGAEMFLRFTTRLTRWTMWSCSCTRALQAQHLEQHRQHKLGGCVLSPSFVVNLRLRLTRRTL